MNISMLVAFCTLFTLQSTLAESPVLLPIDSREIYINQQMASVHTDYSHALARCYERLYVNSCKDHAQQIRNQKLGVLKQRMRELNSEKRIARTKARLETLKEKKIEKSGRESLIPNTQ